MTRSHENPVIASGLLQPEGPAFTGSGRLFVVEMDERRACLTVIDAGSRSPMGPSGGRPTGLAIDGDDCLWVAGGPGAVLLRLDPQGRQIARIDGDDSGRFLFPNDLAFGPDGLLYMTDSGMPPDAFITGLSIRADFFTAHYAGTVFQIDPSSARVLRRIDTGLRFANGLAFAADGTLHVNETLTGWIYRYALDGSARREPFSQTLPAPSPDRFTGPDGMAFDVEGRLYCALYGRGEVSVSDLDGAIIDRLATNGNQPTNLAFVPGENAIVVTEVEHGAVERIEVGAAGALLHRPPLD
jgi:gluconolactonase